MIKACGTASATDKSVMRNFAEIRLQRFITFLSTLIFAIYAFSFMAYYKSPELEVVYDYIATGKLEYNACLFSAVITLLLSFLALWLNRFAGFKREWTAMAFLPSALLLAFVTDVNRSVFLHGKYDYSWLFIFAAGLFVYIVFSFVLNRMLFEKIKNPSMVVNRIIWRNLILLVLLFLLVGCLSGGDKSFKREAMQYVFFKRGNHNAALAVGGQSPIASRQLTSQRAFLLSLQGALPEHFFDYPVYFGAESLLPSVQRDAPIEPDTVYKHIGVRRSEGEKAIDYLERAAYGETATVAARDYYLTALLAERRLVDFVDKIFEFYNVGEVDKLPKQYKEALVLYAYIVPDFDVRVGDDAMQQRFTAMLDASRLYGGLSSSQSHLLRIDYSDTYWWYFLCGE